VAAENGQRLPRSRAEAKAQGSKHYFTGRPCKNGHIDKRNTHQGGCHACFRMRAKKRREEKPDEVRETRRLYRLKNIEKERERDRERSRARYAEDPDFHRAYNKAWREANAESERERGKAKYRRAMEEDPERVRESGRRRDERRRSTPKGRLENSISVGVHRGITKGAKASRRTFDILGYSVDELMAHLEKLFQPGMSWENYGRGGWHIDHKVPLSAHNYNCPDDLDFKRAWSLSNLQPLWEAENMTKGATTTGEFQPSLAFGAANDNDKADDEAA